MVRALTGGVAVAAFVFAGCGAKSSLRHAVDPSDAGAEPDAVVEDTSTQDVGIVDVQVTDTLVVIDSGRDAPLDAGVVVPGAVEVIITADNAYAFGWGSSRELFSYFGDGIGINTRARQIASCPIGGPDGSGASQRDSGPERYVVSERDVLSDDFLYVVAWADSSTAQGLIAQFKRLDGRGETIYSGHPDWEVCATGNDHEFTDTPTKEEVELGLAACDAASTPSRGWVNRDGAVTLGGIGRVALGPKNTEPTVWGPACQPTAAFAPGFDDDAQWVWYNWDPDDTGLDPFRGRSGNPWNDFLIFRIPNDRVLSLVR